MRVRSILMAAALVAAVPAGARAEDAGEGATDRAEFRDILERRRKHRETRKVGAPELDLAKMPEPDRSRYREAWTSPPGAWADVRARACRVGSGFEDTKDLDEVGVCTHLDAAPLEIDFQDLSGRIDLAAFGATGPDRAASLRALLKGIVPGKPVRKVFFTGSWLSPAGDALYVAYLTVAAGRLGLHGDAYSADGHSAGFDTELDDDGRFRLLRKPHGQVAALARLFGETPPAALEALDDQRGLPLPFGAAERHDVALFDVWPREDHENRGVLRWHDLGITTRLASGKLVQTTLIFQLSIPFEHGSSIGRKLPSGIGSGSTESDLVRVYGPAAERGPVREGVLDGGLEKLRLAWRTKASGIEAFLVDGKLVRMTFTAPDQEKR